MEKATLSDKIRTRNELKDMIYKNSELSGVDKMSLEKMMASDLDKAQTKEDINRIKEKVQNALKVEKKKVVQEVATNIKDPKKLVGSEISSVSTLNRDNGNVITSIKSKDGSIYVKDSSYSGNINQVVTEVAKANTGMDKNELTNAAFKEMQNRQIDINMTPINSSGYSENEKIALNAIRGDNKRVNSEYQILIDEKNRLTDLKNMQLNSENKEIEQNVDGKSNEKVEAKGKVKVLKMTLPNINDAAFVDAMLLGTITLYTGILGLCAIFSKM